MLYYKAFGRRQIGRLPAPIQSPGEKEGGEKCYKDSQKQTQYHGADDPIDELAFEIDVF